MTEAVDMLAQKNNDASHGPQIWADLGSGSGMFTLALAGLLPPESIIHAVDTSMASLNKIPGQYNSVKIEKNQIDFVTNPLPFHNLDGILMANSLHYVKDKKSFLTSLTTHLKNDGCFLIVEYDTDIPVSTWVPYPVSFSLLKGLFVNAGYNTIHKINERASVYGKLMYSAIIKK